MTEVVMNEQPPTRLLKAKEVARQLNISKAMAYRLMQRGEIRCVRIGTAVRVRSEDLATFIHDRLSEPNF